MTRIPDARRTLADSAQIAWRAPRRALLKGGLAGLAAVMTRALPGCGPVEIRDASTPPDASPDTGSRPDAGPDAALDAAPDVPTPMPDAVAPDAADAGMMEPAWGDTPPRMLPPAPRLRSRLADLGPLGAPDANGVRVPPGFRARVLARSGQRVPGSMYDWHLAPDGGATYATEDGGWIYVSNSEMPLIGGVGSLRFGPDGTLRDAYRILDRTGINCAGGKTPWHSWLSCEEGTRGRVYECDPWGERRAAVRPALGVFKHEAAAVDPVNAHVYLTEDESDGRFYRFVPERRTRFDHPDLTSGRLEVAAVDAMGRVTWLPVPDPLFTGMVPTRMQVPASTAFRGGEGIWYFEGVVYFSTKGDDRVWAYDVATARLTVLYDRMTAASPILRGVDNVTVSCCGDVLVAEDGGSMQIVAILPGGALRPVMQIVGHMGSEVTGPAFDPSGTRLYFSSQRGTDGNGITYEIEGPFHAPA